MTTTLFKAAGDRRGLSPAQRLQEKGKFVARLKKRFDDGEFARDTIARIGVVSLSKNALSIPMWSHYAEFHRGFVLEFRIPVMGTKQDDSLATDRLLPFPVKYSAQRPQINIGDEQSDLVEKSLLTKSLDWVYEEEERVVDQERGPGIYYYNRDEILSSVIAGMNLEDKNYSNLQSIINDLQKHNLVNLSLYKAQPKNDEYKLVVNGHPRLSN